ncbi:beta-lactamase domain protein [Desulfatibacillum aliphaticivorans]|uniref:Beta-lactamase domain protein n=1 Tax=Desulfatibacillum aliphaticivorans TaxID=218208 RepID=B8FLH7_DESAL|nr:ribonuclease Z [Desulfatibacillum aliphaticivorans]ACL05123.1 beta-lactamase domain protein [Desulfatibacillum aliphaticivorans]
MKISILGSGTCVPSLERSTCSALVSAGDSRLLFDSGAGTMRRLLETGHTIQDVTHIFFSHLHPDHVGEFVPFLFSTKYPKEYGRRTPFSIIAARGFKEFYKNLQSAFGGWIVLDPGIMEILEVDADGPDRRDFADFTVETRPMEHTDQSVGFRINAGSKSFVYSGDTDYCQDLIDLALGADLLLCECALPDENKVPGHLTPSQAGEIAALAEVKKLVLTHFYPECDEAPVFDQCRKTWSGPLDLAQDLMEILI